MPAKSCLLSARLRPRVPRSARVSWSAALICAASKLSWEPELSIEIGGNRRQCIAPGAGLVVLDALRQHAENFATIGRYRDRLARRVEADRQDPEIGDCRRCLALGDR